MFSIAYQESVLSGVERLIRRINKPLSESPGVPDIRASYEKMRGNFDYI